VASQKLLIDRLNQMASDAGLELFLISQGLFCYLSAIADEVEALKPAEAQGLLEVCPSKSFPGVTPTVL
jgi:hypothetical protein